MQPILSRGPSFLSVVIDHNGFYEPIWRDIHSSAYSFYPVSKLSSVGQTSWKWLGTLFDEQYYKYEKILGLSTWFTSPAQTWQFLIVQLSLSQIVVFFLLFVTTFSHGTMPCVLKILKLAWNYPGNSLIRSTTALCDTNVTICLTNPNWFPPPWLLL